MTGIVPDRDISPDFRWDRTDTKVMEKILPHEGKPEAIRLFAREAYKLTNYGYWFLLSTLWVSYTGWSDLETWKKFLSSSRPQRETSIMKPSELKIFRSLPATGAAYRAHRPEETDWISYSVMAETAAIFAVRRGVEEIKKYKVSKSDILCLFLRRGEYEVLILDKDKPEYMGTIKVLPGDKQWPLSGVINVNSSTNNSGSLP